MGPERFELSIFTIPRSEHLFARACRGDVIATRPWALSAIGRYNGFKYFWENQIIFFAGEIIFELDQ